MKILEPVDLGAIPIVTGNKVPREHDDLFERVLGLNGKALPVEFENADVALSHAHRWKSKTSACFGRGIRVQQRGNTLYLSKRVS